MDDRLIQEIERQIEEAVALAQQIQENVVPATDSEPVRTGGTESGTESAAAAQTGRRARIIWRAVCALSVAAAVICVALIAVYVICHGRSEQANEQLRQYVYHSDDETETGTEETSQNAEEGEEKSENVVDFDKLREENEDICAWLYIPGTDVDYPVMQADDNSYYLSHDAYGRYSPDGSIFVDAGCGASFDDFDTIIYGHNMSSGTMFKTLHNYEDEAFWDENREVYVYLPGRRLVYEVFAAYRTDDRHILTYNDFSRTEVRQSYLDEIFAEKYDTGTVKNDETVDVDSHILTLSTCCGMSGKRWLVQAVLCDEK